METDVAQAAINFYILRYNVNILLVGKNVKKNFKKGGRFYAFFWLTEYWVSVKRNYILVTLSFQGVERDKSEKIIFSWQVEKTVEKGEEPARSLHILLEFTQRGQSAEEL